MKWLAITFCCLFVLLLSEVFGAEVIRTIEETFSASEFSQVMISGHTGKIHVIGNSEDTILLNLQLKPKKGKPDLNTVQLISNKGAGGLTLKLDVPFDREQMDEVWELQVPSKFAANLEMNVGKIEVENLSGDLELDVGVGKITASSAHGSVQANVKVGDIRVDSQTDSYGNVSLDSNVGNVHLILNGHKVVFAKPPGAGNSIRLDGPGRDEIDLQSGIGDVHLSIEPSKN